MQINNYKTETLVIDKDSTGKLWATWQQDNTIYVNRTVNGDDHTWGTPFPLPLAPASVTIDDNSAVIAFHGDKIGIMWSNQTTANDAMWFAVHNDGQPDTTWSAARTAIQGPNTGDDHINLKSIQADGSGRVYAAVKTSFTSSAQPLIMLLVRDTVTGDWANYPIARVSDCPNRPLVLIDEQNRVLHAFFSAPGPTAYDCNSSGGEINEKTSPLDAISFPIGAGTPVMIDFDSPYVHNASSTKQNVNSQTGILVIARNSHTTRYWHYYESIGGSPPPRAGGQLQRHADPRHGAAHRQLHRHVDEQPDELGLDLRRRRHLDGRRTRATPTRPRAPTRVTLTATDSGGSDTKTNTAYITVEPASPPGRQLQRHADLGHGAARGRTSPTPRRAARPAGRGPSATAAPRRPRTRATRTRRRAPTRSRLTATNAGGSDTRPRRTTSP